MNRLVVQPAERIDRQQALTFTFDGKPVQAFAGDTIASALLAAGTTVMSRSFKYHRPRGEMCGCGQCSNSLVQIGDAPGVRACSELVVEGLRVEHQNAWPSLKFDVMRAGDRLGPIGGTFMQVGFYYKTFIRPRRMWPVYEKVLRRAAGLGKLPEHQDEREWRTEYRRRHCDVLVIGGGIAGMAAAARAAELGADVVLCDDDIELGGTALADGNHERAHELAQRVRAAGVEVIERGSALGYFDGLVPIVQGDTLHQVRAQQHVAATGALEQPFVFPNNDLPGIMLAGGAQRLASLYAIRVGRRAVVATVNDRGLAAALALQRAGVPVEAVADLRADAAQRPLAAELAAAGVTIVPGSTIVQASGDTAVKSVVVARVDAAGLSVPGSEQEITCDVVGVNAGMVPTSSLLLQAGARAQYEPSSGRFLPGALPTGVHAAGAVAGFEDIDAAEQSGIVAGTAAAVAFGAGGSTAQDALADARRSLEALPAAAPSVPPPAYAHSKPAKGKAFVDLDEDVTVKDIAHAIEEGYDSIELSKRYTTVTMGPSQGRFSQLPSVRLVAEKTGLSLDEVGLTTARPPWSTVPIGALAGRPFEPAKRSALHASHRALGASVRWAGDWRRAYDYGDPEAEALAVQESAGLIDVSTLGKLMVRGSGAGELLDRLYPNRLSNIAPGRIRYGVLLSDAGRITDDGTVCCLDDDTFYVTTTSAGASTVEQWFSWWLAVWGLDVHLTDVTQGVAAMNLAGPKAREVLQSLTDLDCSNEGFAYLDGKHALVADVPCLLLRIGFVGEVGYEIHCPAAHGDHLWNRILEAGAGVGVRPFGLEPQRILRLQKQHIIVGQDTDSESTPYNTAMPWVVKLDKEQNFIGRRALELLADREPVATLVGFTMDNGYVPAEGAVIVHGGEPAGQVTSVRHSPKLGQVIGMATVPPELATDDTRITISDAGRTFQATITTRPFYDPEGAVLRS